MTRQLFLLKEHFGVEECRVWIKRNVIAEVKLALLAPPRIRTRRDTLSCDNYEPIQEPEPNNASSAANIIPGRITTRRATYTSATALVDVDRDENNGGTTATASPRRPRPIGITIIENRQIVPPREGTTRFAPKVQQMNSRDPRITSENSSLYSASQMKVPDRGISHNQTHVQQTCSSSQEVGDNDSTRNMFQRGRTLPSNRLYQNQRSIWDNSSNLDYFGNQMAVPYGGYSSNAMPLNQMYSY